MSKTVKIFLFSDALGWEIVEKYKFMENRFPFRYPVKTQLGYSSTAVPTILSGEPPTVHGHFSFFFLDKDGKSPFKLFKYIHWLLHPAKIFDNHRIRRRLSKILQRYFNFTGYFNLYRLPYKRLPLFDYCEKKDIFAPRGLDNVANISDMLNESGVKFNISNWHLSDGANMAAARKLLEAGEVEFLFIYTAGLDGMLHFHVHEPEFVRTELAKFEQEVERIINAATANYTDFQLMLFSDHGMTPLVGSVDLKTIIEKTPYVFGRDYAACYDSTMLRIWFLNPVCRTPLMDSLAGSPGHWLSEEEKRNFNVDFVDSKYGEEIFLLDPGMQLVPSDMGEKAIPGMHGYSPLDKYSDACLLSTSVPEYLPLGIAGFFTLMKLAADKLRRRS